MEFLDKEKKLHQHYEKIGLLKNDRLTAFDYNLRNLEIECAKSYISPSSTVLDIGSGPGLACFEYAALDASVIGIDYAQSMVDFATQLLLSKHQNLAKNLRFDKGSALALPYEPNSFNVITSHRVLIAILSWESQQQALKEIARCLEVGGLYLMFEACVEGLKVLNNFRKMFGLSEVSERGCGDYERLLFSEGRLKKFMEPSFELVTVHSFGMYYFITRILQPLLVAPEKPSYNHKLNDVAFEIAKKIPDFQNQGHLKGYIWRKKR